MGLLCNIIIWRYLYMFLHFYSGGHSYCLIILSDFTKPVFFHLVLIRPENIHRLFLKYIKDYTRMKVSANFQELVSYYLLYFLSLIMLDSIRQLENWLPKLTFFSHIMFLFFLRIDLEQCNWERYFSVHHFERIIIIRSYMLLKQRKLDSEKIIFSFLFIILSALNCLFR